jgi:preprotein translocase subunit SecG
MPQVLHNVILVVHIILAVSLTGIIILMQRSEGGMGGLGGGGGGGSGGMGGFLAGRTQANVITRTTAILATGFFLTSLTLAIADHRGRTSGPLVPDAAPLSTSAPATRGRQIPPSNPSHRLNPPPPAASNSQPLLVFFPAAIQCLPERPDSFHKGLP